MSNPSFVRSLRLCLRLGRLRGRRRRLDQRSGVDLLHRQLRRRHPDRDRQRRRHHPARRRPHDGKRQRLLLGGQHRRRTNDIDSGECIVTSPIYNLSKDSNVSIWYFHGQRDAGDDSGDFFFLETSTDGGSNWSVLQTYGDETIGAAWTEATASASAGDDLRFRVRAADGPSAGDLVEAGVDDLLICPTAPACTTGEDCDDGLYCNGEETCDAGSCQAGTPPDCDDGVSCTVDACDEDADACVNTADDAPCNDGEYCTGVETCDDVAGCQIGTPVACDDGVACTADSCDEAADACAFAANDALCEPPSRSLWDRRRFRDRKQTSSISTIFEKRHVRGWRTGRGAHRFAVLD